MRSLDGDPWAVLTVLLCLPRTVGLCLLYLLIAPPVDLRRAPIWAVNVMVFLAMTGIMAIEHF